MFLWPPSLCINMFKIGIYMLLPTHAPFWFSSNGFHAVAISLLYLKPQGKAICQEFVPLKLGRVLAFYTFFPMWKHQTALSIWKVAL